MLSGMNTQETPLYEAVDANSAEAVGLLLEAGADPTVIGIHGEPLAGMAKSLEVLDLLLKAEADLVPRDRWGTESPEEAVGRTLAEIAGNTSVDRHERTTMVHRCIEARSMTAVPLDSALAHASFRHDPDAVSVLLEVGADPHRARPHLLGWTCFGVGGRASLVPNPFDDDDALDEIDKAGVERVIEMLVAAGLDPDDEDARGFRALHTALAPDTYAPGNQSSDGYNGRAALALIRCGAEIDLTYPATDVVPADGQEVDGLAPLHFAAREGDFLVVQALLDAGADPEARTPGGQRALDLALAHQVQINGENQPARYPPSAAGEWGERTIDLDRRRWEEAVAFAERTVALLDGLQS
jgi:cytohesin